MKPWKGSQRRNEGRKVADKRSRNESEVAVRSRSCSRSKRSEEESEVEDNRKELRCVVWGRLLERLATTSPALYTRKSLYRVCET